MNRILASYKKIFSLVQEHSVVSALVLLLVLLSPLAGLDAVQTMGDQIFHAAVIEGYEVFDGNCQLTESAITQRTGRSQHLAFLEEKISTNGFILKFLDRLPTLTTHRPDSCSIGNLNCRQAPVAMLTASMQSGPSRAGFS